jgi:hypothetical protein
MNMGSGSCGQAASVSVPDQPALTEIERKVLEFVERAALQDRELEGNDDIAHHLGFTGTGTVRGIMLRLERKGYIRTVSYQRGRKIEALRIGKSTKPPMCVVPHWRTILEKSEATPSLPVVRILAFPTIMNEIQKLQRERNISFPDAQLVLMAHGVQMLAFTRAREGENQWYG